MEIRGNMDTTKALTVQSTEMWITRSCATPGCTATIRELIGQHDPVPVCKWCLSQTAYNIRDAYATKPSDGPMMSLDEFGRDLFDAIKAQAGAIQAYKTSAIYAAKGLTLKAEDAARAGHACQVQLETILQRNTIAVEDVRRILAMQ